MRNEIEEAHARLDPDSFIEELQMRERVLRRQYERELASRLFVEEMLVRGARAPGRDGEPDQDPRLDDDGSFRWG